MQHGERHTCRYDSGNMHLIDVIPPLPTAVSDYSDFEGFLCKELATRVPAASIELQHCWYLHERSGLVTSIIGGMFKANLISFFHSRT